MANHQKHKIDEDRALVVGLSALGWAVADDARAQRLLALTGIDPAHLRAAAGEPALLAEVIRFLEAHEPDLIACANALDLAPEDMVATRIALENFRHGPTSADY